MNCLLYARGRPRVLCALVALLVAACGENDALDPGTAPGVTAPADGIRAGAPAPQPVRCSAPPDVGGAPRSIAQLLELVNALPKPLEISCLLESLERPIEMYATRSTISAQPAEGSRSPRMFLFEDPLIMSVAPAGPGAQLLELGELRSATTSLKGEIAFPVTETLAPAAPFERVMFDEQRTGCAFCHRSEEQAPDIVFTKAFISLALRPVPNEKVSVESLVGERSACDAAVEAERCAMLEALFGPGDVRERAFPPELETFF